MDLAMQWSAGVWSTSLLMFTVVAMTTHCYAGAGIATDGSLGARVTISGTNAGPGNYLIPQTLGTLSGNNLFHSFSAFNLDTGQSATFTTTTNTLANVISRVTGGSASQINGALKLIPAAGSLPAFFFINPAGVVLGAGASIDVPGAFHVSTADYVKFADGSFHAELAKVSTLSSATPEAFGFLGTNRSAVQVKDAILQSYAGNLSFVAGDVRIDHAGVSAESGKIKVVATGSGAREISIGQGLPVVDGLLEIRNGGYLYTESKSDSTIGGGNIEVAAGETRITDGGGIATATSGEQPAGSIRAELGSLLIDGRSVPTPTGITSQAAISDTGAGGDVSLSVRGDVRILGGGRVTSDSYGIGHAGNVLVNAGSLLLDGAGHQNGARITNRAADGNAGTLVLESVDTIQLVNASQISSDSFGSGQAGSIRLWAGNNIQVLKDSFIASDAYDSENAGDISLVAKNITIDGMGGSLLTQISSQALYGSQGNAGSIEVLATGNLSLINGGKIRTNTNSIGLAGGILVSAETLLIDGRDYDGSTGIFSTCDFLGSGNAGSLDIQVAKDARILQSGKISTNTWGQGNGGQVFFKSTDLLIDGMGNLAGADISSEAAYGSTGHGGSVSVDVSGHLQIANLGFVSSATSSTGNAGSVSVKAGRLTVDTGSLDYSLAGIESSSLTGGTGNAGDVSVAVSGDAVLTNFGYVRSDTLSSGSGGDITFSAGNLRVNKGGKIASSAGGSGRAGNIDLLIGGELNILGGGRIRSDTMGSGDAGWIGIQADRIVLSKGDTQSFAWILSDSSGSGTAGSIDIRAGSSLKLDDGGFISSDAYDQGSAGTISVNAPEILIIGSDSGIGAAISSDTYAAGHAGHVSVSGRNLSIQGGDTVFNTGITTSSGWQATGNAGDVEVMATENLSLSQNAIIDSSTRSSGNAGTVRIDVGVHFAVNAGGVANSATFSTGNAGSVKVTAGSITIDRMDGSYTGITSQAGAGSSGNAGIVDVNAYGNLSLLNGGRIDSATHSSGSAGAVKVGATDLLVDGYSMLDGRASSINAFAGQYSSGQTGEVSVSAGQNLRLSNAGELSIRNDASRSDPERLIVTMLTVAAPALTLENASITAASTGNINASNIIINTSDGLWLDTSVITTSANQGNGGAITINGGWLLWLDNSQIATSVTGPLNGNGGNISIAADSLVMNTGFIQANTAAANATGGLVSISAQNLVPSGNTLFLGGSTPYTFQPGVFGFNVIQAAAPTGISGMVQISSPTLDLSASLVGLNTRMMLDDQLARYPCDNAGGSSLILLGRGGLPLSAQDFLSPGQFPLSFIASPATAAGIPTVRTVTPMSTHSPCQGVL